MAFDYRWDSQQSMNDIINALQEKTDREKNIDPWTFRYKFIENGVCKFSLTYNRYWLRSPTFRQSYLKGTITETVNGCNINAMVHFTLENIAIYIMIFIFFMMSVAAIYANFKNNYIVVIMYLLMSASYLTWNIYTYKQSKKGQPHLDIVTYAAKVKPSVKDLC